MADIKRLNYFSYQFLVEDDFKDEQAYHRGMRHRHNRELHLWGVTDNNGLEVTPAGDKKVAIGPGTAIDKCGQEMVLLAPRDVDLTEFGANTDVYLTIVYNEVFDKEDHYTAGGVDDYTRKTERPKVIIFGGREDKSLSDILEVKKGNPPSDGSVITLALVKLDGSGNVGVLDKRIRAGSVIAPDTVGTEELKNSAITEEKMVDEAVSARIIRKKAVTGEKIAENQITGAHLQDNAVTSIKIKDESVGTTKLVDNSVPLSKIKLRSIIQAPEPRGDTLREQIVISNVKKRHRFFFISVIPDTPDAPIRWWLESGTDRYCLVIERPSGTKYTCQIYELEAE